MAGKDIVKLEIYLEPLADPNDIRTQNRSLLITFSEKDVGPFTIKMQSAAREYPLHELLKDVEAKISEHQSARNAVALKQGGLD